MAISANDVKTLRDATGAGMMDCKRALQEADGDFEAAKDILRQRGQAKGAKREGRATGEGTIAVATAADQTRAVVLELNCETDFVGRSEDFRNLAQQLANQALESGAQSGEDLDVTALLDEAVSRIGERIQIGRLVNWQAAQPGLVAVYLHTATNRIAVPLEIGLDQEAGEQRDEVLALGRDLAMQVAAMRPVCVDRSGVPEEAVERERNVLRQAQDMANKPPQIQDKIITGRLDKFYGEVCLLEQEYTRESGKRVDAVVAEAAKRLGRTITIRRFERVEVGAGQQAEADGEE